jgi:hypothetical protein
MDIWVIGSLIVLAILSGGYLLRLRGYTRPANAVLALLALPGATYIFFLIVVVLSGTSWN